MACWELVTHLQGCRAGLKDLLGQLGCFCYGPTPGYRWAGLEGRVIEAPPEGWTLQASPPRALRREGTTTLFPEMVLLLFKKYFLYSFLRGGERGKEKERNIHVWLPLVHPLLGT